MTVEAARGAAPFPWRVDRLDSIDSTNPEARRRALAGDVGRLWIVAAEQTAGRGRRGRTWVSPRGNLHASALLINPCPQARSPQLGFVAGVALARAAEDLGALEHDEPRVRRLHPLQRAARQRRRQRAHSARAHDRVVRARDDENLPAAGGSGGGGVGIGVAPRRLAGAGG